jgi:hypothetical protein
MRLRALIPCALAIVALAGCASNDIKMAEATTRAVYDNNYDGVTQNFTPDLAKQVTRAEVGQLSDVMHSHGDFKGLTETGTEPDGAYDFRADFSNGSMIVKMKLDSSGKITGYRVIPASST